MSAWLRLDDERFDDVADLHVVVALEHDAALETGRDFVDVVVLADVTARTVDDDERVLLLRHLREGALDRLERALHVGLEHELELLRLAFLDLREHLVQRRRALATRRRGALPRVALGEGLAG